MSDKNANRPGYKHTPLGWIPEEWEVKELWQITDVSRPISYGIVQTGVEVDNGVKCVRVTDLNNGKIIEENLITTTEKISSSYKKTILKKGDLIIALRGKIGELAIVGRTLEGANLTRGVALLALQKRYNSEFIYYQLTSPNQRRIFERSLNGSALQELSIGVLRKIPIVVSEFLQEQESIGQVLRTCDRFISITQKLITSLQKRNKGLMQQLLTGKKRGAGFKKKWQKLHIKDFATEVSIKNKSNKDLVVMSCTKYSGLVDSLEYFGRKIYSDDTSTYKIVPGKHFAYATNHIEEGSIGYQERYSEALISPMYTVFRTNERVLDDFLYLLLKSHMYLHEYRKRMEGSIDRRGGLRWDEFSKIPVSLPDYEEQEYIARILRSASVEIQHYERKLEYLQQQKKSLMQKLLTGEVRVKTPEPVA